MVIGIYFILLCICGVNSNIQEIFQSRQEKNIVHLSVNPSCGSVGGQAADLNAGIRPETIRTIVSFGDSFTSAGKDDGSPQDPPVLNPPSILAGGRSTNGYIWVEDLAFDLHESVVKNYAQSGACVDLSLWPSNPNKVDFIGQVKTFLSQGNNLNPNTTLYSIFFGINDYIASLQDGDHMQEAALKLLEQIDILSRPPTNARSFMVLDVYGRGTVASQGEQFKQTVFSGLSKFHNRTNGTQIAVSYVDFSTIWNGVLGTDPGYKEFGYASSDTCCKCTADGCSMNGMCSDPDHYFYWIPGHPSKDTQRIMADYVRAVWQECAPGSKADPTSRKGSDSIPDSDAWSRKKLMRHKQRGPHYQQ